MKFIKTIIYKPVKCPICFSKKTFIRNKKVQGEESIRYHKCKDCKKWFRSIEE